MSTVAVASNQQWKTVVFGQIKERNLNQTNGFKDIVKLYNAALRKEKEYKDRIVALEKEMMSLRQENSSGFKKPAGDNQRAVSSPSPELEAKLQKLQEELTVSYKRNADNAQHMIDLSRRMKETQEENEKRVAETALYKQKMEEAQAEEIRIREKMEDEGKTFRILQEEHLALRQSHDTILEENRRMLAENQQLVDRWLRKMAEEAEKMNTANAFYEQMVNDKTRHDVNNKVNPNNNAPLPLTNAAPVPVVMKTAFFDAASFVDCNAILPAKPKRKISGHSDALTCVAYSRSGLVMATGSTDKTIRLWDAPSGMSKNVLHGPTQSVMCLNFSPSDEALLGASNDNACRIWGVDNCRLRHTLTGHVGKVFSAVFADTQKVITGSHDRTIKLWDLTKGYCTRTIFCFSSLNDLCIAPDGTLLVSGHIDHHLRFWDTKNGEVVHVMDGIHDSQITSVSLSPDGTKVLTNSRDNTLKIVDIRTHEVIVTLKDENYRNGLNWTRAAISPDSRYAAAGSMDGTLIVWNAMTGKVEKTIAKAHDSAIAACAWNPMGHQFASAGDKDKTIVIWE